MNRRDLLAAMLQALFLALFPWLRSEKGVQVAKEAAERYLYRLDTVTQDGVELQWGDAVLVYDCDATGNRAWRDRAGVWQVAQIGAAGGTVMLERPVAGMPTRFARYMKKLPPPEWRFLDGKINWHLRRVG